MNKIKKMTILASIVLLSSMATATVFGWFYFPNAKGLEMDTAPSLDLTVNLYKSNGVGFTLQTPTSYREATSNDFDNGFIPGTTYYSLTPTKATSYSGSATYYVKSATAYTLIGTLTEEAYLKEDNLYTIVAQEEDTYNSNTKYYIPAYSIEEKYEFFQWGNEYICEDLDATHYYALECICNSNAYTDGYIKSVLNLKLDCLGAFLYDQNQVANASIPVFEASYKYASTSVLDLSSSNALSEAKAQSTTIGSEGRVSAYKKLINGNYYEKSGNNYSVATTYSSSSTYYTMDISEYFIKTSQAWTDGGYASKNMYYFENGTYIPTTTYQDVTDYYTISNIEEAESVAGFGTTGSNFTTVDGISSATDYQILNSIEMDRFYSTSILSGLDYTQYVHGTDETHEEEYIRFIIFFKIEPDEDYITSYMSRNSSLTDSAASTEILISNSLSIDLTLRSVAKYDEYPVD